MRYLSHLILDRRGVTMLEYGLIAGVVAIVAVVGFATLGNGLGNQMQNLANCVNSPTTTRC
jgi:pilus assembly protein Flp/PilA